MKSVISACQTLESMLRAGHSLLKIDSMMIVDSVDSNQRSRELDKIVTKIIIDFYVRSERACAGAGVLMLKKLSVLSSNHSLTKKQNKPACVGSLPKKQDIERVLQRAMLNCDDSTYRAALTAITLTGFNGKIFLKKIANKSDKIIIELIESFEFYTENNTDVKSWSEPAVLCIDGFVESVAELNRILLSAADSKQPVVLFVRGASEEVITTINRNNDIGNFSVCVAKIPLDIDSANSMRDIATVCGCDVISSDKGQLISSLSLSDFSTIDHIAVQHNRVQIKNNKTLNSIKILRDSLIQKQKKSGEFGESLLKKRIMSLCGRSAVIHLPDDDDFVRRSSFIDVSLRTFKSLLDYGVCEDSPAAIDVVSEVFLNLCLDSVNRTGAVLIKQS